MTQKEVAEYKRQVADDWQAWRAEEESIEMVDPVEMGLDYFLEGRFEDLDRALQGKCPEMKKTVTKTQFGACIELSW